MASKNSKSLNWSFESLSDQSSELAEKQLMSTPQSDAISSSNKQARNPASFFDQMTRDSDGEQSCRPKPKTIFAKYTTITPMTENSRGTILDDVFKTRSYWDVVNNIRDVMLQNKKGEGFTFGKKDVAEFNKLAEELYDDLVSRKIQMDLLIFFEKRIFTE